ncbi:hypothetical protein COCMIDRAFT_9530 [Bipolaris oryzae ATCC 44560]|uniref:Uncharacterized protein n=1 Tax=Bipolaris oryzae ATCC 44560 TaxID=930090 RepID=W6YYJ2_COCMI|nr:uncharacterized protein COCMIDRAFT_9530 [Bipolaris oryzae ATCC 44560]EUC40629.1 hypothetical protein COCMIDRAFT_9530 [Bipolaris oryzae ATCC 44560]
MPPDPRDTMLSRLEPLDPNNYIMALSAGSDQFIGSPNGYKATYIPSDVLYPLFTGLVKRITWASLRCIPNSFFFELELIDGRFACRIGTHIPPALTDFLLNFMKSKTHLPYLRIRYGANDSFVAWSKKVWIYSKVPPQLIVRLQQISSYSNTKYNVTKGDGDVGWSFAAYSVSSAWYEMWADLEMDERASIIAEELAHVTISPYSEKGETFAFIKKTIPGIEPPFIVHFEGEQTYSNFTFDKNNTTAPPKRYPRLENLDDRDFRVAISKKKIRRRRTNDPWDLDLKKGEKLLVLRDMEPPGLTFWDDKVDQDPKAAYARFMEDLGNVPRRNASRKSKTSSCWGFVFTIYWYCSRVPVGFCTSGSRKAATSGIRIGSPGSASLKKPSG